jgi:HAD superfamily hydrolase (TIGR01484 family)
MEFELVVTDLDGTLWERDTAVHDRTRAAMARLAQAGVDLLVATGRRVGSTRRALASIGQSPPAVVLNGALGVELATGARFHRAGFTGADAAAVLDAFRAHGIDPCVYVDDDRHPVWVSVRPSTHREHLASFGDDVATGELREVVESHPVLAFGVLGIPEDDARTVGAALAGVASPHVDRDRVYGGHTVTVAPAAQSKWDGVAAYCAHRGLDPRAVVAIGDGPNDCELLENAALSLVPEDAHRAARAHADLVVGRAADGGWADVLEVLGLEPDGSVGP